MRLLPRMPAARRGFTLIELLVVIAVIAILVGLLMAAVMGVFGTGPATQDRSDVSGLTSALQNFKAKYTFYPPSRLFLSNDLKVYNAHAANPLVQDSLRTLSAMFPNMNWGTVDWTNGAGMPTMKLDGVNVKGVVLEGDQCLVFFLGGLPGPSNSVAGFSTSPSNPTAGGAERIKFFDFRIDRLISVHGNAFLSYKNGHLNLPYAYFSVGRRGPNQYTSGAGNGTGLGTPLPAPNMLWKQYRNSDCATLGVFPYASASGPAKTNFANPTFINPETFQLISAGPDGAFGNGQPRIPAGKTTVPPPVTLWTATNTGFLDKNGEDDISNFSDRVLGAK